jgi:oligopeptide/dipeptide ABC transporter ATP-binding protein
MSEPLLRVTDLTVSLDRRGGGMRVVDAISFELAKGASLGIVGESGSGKSLTLRAIMGLLPSGVQVDGGSVTLDGEPLAFSGRAARRQRRRKLSMVFQDSLTALDPVYTVGAQIAEVGQHVMGLSHKAAWARAVELLDLVGIREPESRAHAYPHELSGGMRQRAMLAVALVTNPQVLLCDEPTTALDVTVQAQVLELLARLRRELDLSLIFVSHDLAVVRQLCDELAVMYTGRIVETGPTDQLLATPLHPYTRGLLDATIELDTVEPAKPIPGSIPEPGNLPSGCSFHPRCGFATAECTTVDVKLMPVGVPQTVGGPLATDAAPGLPEAVDAAAVGGPPADLPEAADVADVGRPQSDSPHDDGRRAACLHWQELLPR